MTEEQSGSDRGESYRDPVDRLGEQRQHVRQGIERRSRVIWVPEHPTFALVAIIFGIVIFTVLVIVGGSAQ